MTLTIGIDCRKVSDFGIGTYIRGLLGAYREISVDEEFVLFGPESLRAIIPESDPRFTIVEETSPHYSIEELAALERQLERYPVDVFHAPHYVTPFGRTRMVVTIHDLIHLDFPSSNPAAILYARWMIGRSIRKSSRILTPSDTVGKAIEKRFVKARGRVTVTPNGVDPAFFTPPDPSTETAFLARLGLERGEYLLYLGNDKPHKNVDLLVRAYREAFSETSLTRLVLIGGDFRRFDSVQGVRHPGFLSSEEIRAAYAAAAALVMPSLYEGFGLPVIEAMASGTPVIISDGGALPEIAGDAALMFALGKPSSLGEALVRIISDPELRATLRQKGLARAREFSWLDTARKTLEVYRAAAGN